MMVMLMMTRWWQRPQNQYKVAFWCVLFTSVKCISNSLNVFSLSLLSSALCNDGVWWSQINGTSGEDCWDIFEEAADTPESRIPAVPIPCLFVQWSSAVPWWISWMLLLAGHGSLFCLETCTELHSMELICGNSYAAARGPLVTMMIITNCPLVVLTTVCHCQYVWYATRVLMYVVL